MVADILVLGGTGFTGQLVTRYLSTHRQRDEFTFAVGGRSRDKLEKLAKELGLDDDVPLVQVDVTSDEDVEGAVAGVGVVINTVGPYSKWGTNVLRACAKLGKAHLDLTGETHWIADMIWHYDYLASKTGAVIIPACGYGSVPSDISAYLGNKTLKAAAGPDAGVERTDSAVEVTGLCGTVASVVTMLEEVPREKINKGMRDYSQSPGITGKPSPPPRLVYKLPAVSPPMYGSLSPMGPIDRHIVERTWGLHALAALNGGPGDKERAYGAEFTYDECWAASGRVSAFLGSLVMLALVLPPVRWVVKRMRPSGAGGDVGTEGGHMVYTSVTTSCPDSQGKRTYVRTVQKGRGDPGYFLTSIIVSEAALSLVLEKDKLPAMAQEGGVLTPMSALGDVLIRRLGESGRFEFESEVISTGT